jgi:hypothetical protein
MFLLRSEWRLAVIAATALPERLTGVEAFGFINLLKIAIASSFSFSESTSLA